jgi:hypothetical protein
VIGGHLAALRAEMLSAAGVIADPMSKYHLQDLARRIDNVLNPK